MSVQVPQIEHDPSSFLRPRLMSTENLHLPSIHAVGLPAAIAERLIQAAEFCELGLCQHTDIDALIDNRLLKNPGCILLPVDGNRTRGLSLVKRLRFELPDLPIVAINDSKLKEVIANLIDQGVHSVLRSDSAMPLLAETLDAAVTHSRRVQQTIEAGRRSLERIDKATAKEREVLDLILDGLRNREIAERLGITVRAVEDRRFRLMKKVGVDSVAELIVVAMEARHHDLGLI